METTEDFFLRKIKETSLLLEAYKKTQDDFLSKLQVENCIEEIKHYEVALNSLKQEA